MVSVYIIKRCVFFLSYLPNCLLILLQPNFVWWYIIINRNVMLESMVAVFKVKVTLKVQDTSECLSKQYFLNR